MQPPVTSSILPLIRYSDTVERMRMLQSKGIVYTWYNLVEMILS
ncbi:hypothetical protein BBOR36S_02327 [Brevibacillus borstelensis]